MSRSKCGVDYLSFTFSPIVIRRLVELARIGACLKSKLALAGIDWRLNASELSAQLASLLCPGIAVSGGVVAADSPEFLSQQKGFLLRNGFEFEDFEFDPSLDDATTESASRFKFFQQRYDDLIQSFGLELMNSLCLSEIDHFIAMLNESIAFGNESHKRWSYRVNRSGRFGYVQSATLLCDGLNAGLVAWGAENFGCLVSFSGAGCAALDLVRLHDCLNRLSNRLIPAFVSESASFDRSTLTYGVKITRLDICLDDYYGRTFTPRSMFRSARHGLFCPAKGRPPKIRKYESGELIRVTNQDAEGRKYNYVPSDGMTLYVGSRESGKLCRVYEKGKQLRSEDFPRWCRAEVEWHSKDRVIPFDALINPDAYFSAAYPALRSLVSRTVQPLAIPTFRNMMKTSVSVAIENGRRQCGRLINMMRNVLELPPQEIVSMLTQGLEYDAIPERIQRPIPQDDYDSFNDLNLYRPPVRSFYEVCENV